MGSAFIISLKNTDIEEFKNKDNIIKSSEMKQLFEINRNDQILLYSNDQDKIVGELDVNDVRVSQSGISIKTEPIYIAPSSNGVKTDDLLFLQLSTYNSTSHWKYKLRNPLTKINYNDYKFISKKLILG